MTCHIFSIILSLSFFSVYPNDSCSFRICRHNLGSKLNELLLARLLILALPSSPGFPLVFLFYLEHAWLWLSVIAELALFSS